MSRGHARRARGEALLLRHLAAFDRLTADDGGRARARLEAKLGAATTRQLLRSLGASGEAARS
jgi:hypothetical protein